MTRNKPSLSDDMAKLQAQHDRDRAEIARLDAALVEARAENERLVALAARSIADDEATSAHGHERQRALCSIDAEGAGGGYATCETAKRLCTLERERDEVRAEAARMRPVYEAAKAWRDTWRHRAPFGEESKAVALVDAVDAALDGRWARCEEPAQGDGVPACGWTGEMRQLRRDRDGVTRCPACGSTAIAEDLAPPQEANRG